MGQFGFEAPAQGAFEAVRKILAEAEQQKRQAMLDQITKSTAARQDEVARGQLAVNEENIAASKAAREAAAQNVIEDNQRANAPLVTPGVVTPEQAKMLPGFMVSQGPATVTQGAQTGVDANDVPQYDVKTTPGLMTYSGTPQQQMQIKVTEALKGVDVSDRDAVSKAVSGIVPVEHMKEFVDGVVGPVTKAPRDLYLDRQGNMTLIQSGKRVPLPADFVRRAEDVVHQEPAPSASDAQGGADVMLSDDAKKMFAKQLATGGQLPALGSGKAGAMQRKEIADLAATYDRATDTFRLPGVAGAVPDLTSAKAINTALTSTLTQTENKIATISSFSRTAQDNAVLLKAAFAKVPNTGVPWLNTPVRSISRGLFGNEQLSAMNALRQSVNSEYTRIVNDPNLKGVVAEAARQEMETILSNDATPQQIMTALDALQKETSNREGELKKERERIKGEIGVAKKDESAAQKNEEAAKPRKKYNPATGKAE